MSVSIEVLLELDKAEQAANQWQEEFVQNVRKAASEGESAFAKFGSKTDEELKRLAASAQEAGKRTREAFGQKAERALNGLRDVSSELRDVWDLTATTLFKVKEENVKAISEGFYIMEKGISVGTTIGSAFGPIGTIVGGAIGTVVGATVGWINANENIKKAENELTIKVREESAERVRIARKQAQDIGIELRALVREYDNSLINQRKALGGSEEVAKLQKDPEASPLIEALNGQFGAMSDANLKLQKSAEDRAELEGKIASGKLTDAGVIESARKKFDDEDKLLKSHLDEQKTLYDEALTNVTDYQSNKKAKQDKDLENSKEYYEAQKTLFLKHLEALKAARAKENAYWDAKATAQIQDYEAVNDATTKVELDAMNARATAKQKGLDAEHANWKQKVAIDLENKKKSADEEKAMMEESIQQWESATGQIAGMFANTFTSIVSDSFNNYWEYLATGEKQTDKSFKKMAAAMARNLGSQLIADGTKNVLMGAGNMLLKMPNGAALMALGGAEIATGAAMGGIGARAQRKQGYGDEEKSSGPSGGSLGRGSSANTGTQVQAPTIVNLGLLAITDQRQMEQAGKQIAMATSAYKQGRL